MSQVQSAPYTCDSCRQPIPVCGGVSYGSLESGHRELCNRCFNEEIARSDGINFQHVEFQPLEMLDAAGQRHEFHFRLRLLGDRVALDAFELRDDEPRGYHFQALGDPQGDLFALMGQLVERMRRALALRHLEYDKQFGWTIADFLARGRITWDDEQDGRIPLLVIDGHEITWEQFGRMLMSFEGWQFKLEIHDRSKEI
jgi:hypothetical protein